MSTPLSDVFLAVLERRLAVVLAHLAALQQVMRMKPRNRLPREVAEEEVFLCMDSTCR